MEILHQATSFIESHIAIFTLAIPLVTGAAGYFFARKKNSVELSKLEVDTEKSELELANGFVEFFKEKAEEMLIEITKLKKELKELKDVVDDLKGNQCLGDSCPDRIELKKIYTARLKRRQARAKTKNNNEQ